MLRCIGAALASLSACVASVSFWRGLAHIVVDRVYTQHRVESLTLPESCWLRMRNYRRQPNAGRSVFKLGWWQSVAVCSFAAWHYTPLCILASRVACLQSDSHWQAEGRKLELLWPELPFGSKQPSSPQY